MHFNDLLMRLRSQSLAAIAAVGAIVGLFGKEGIADIRVSWLAATGIFFAMAMFWMAVWCLDFLYYNRLLSGAVAAIVELEDQTKRGRRAQNIQMSTTIEAEFDKPMNFGAARGILAFYIIVLIVITFGGVGSAIMYSRSSTTPPVVSAPRHPIAPMASLPNRAGARLRPR